MLGQKPNPHPALVGPTCSGTKGTSPAGAEQETSLVCAVLLITAAFLCEEVLGRKNKV